MGRWRAFPAGMLASLIFLLVSGPGTGHATNDEDLQRVTGLSSEQYAHAADLLARLPAAREPATCHDGPTCLRELYARLHVNLYRAHVLPVGLSPWFRDDGHPHHGLPAEPQPRQGMEAGHELALERRMLAHFLGNVKAQLGARGGQPLVCLEWDAPLHSGGLFGDLCGRRDVVVFDGPGTPPRAVDTGDGRGSVAWHTDVEGLAALAGPGAFDVVFCAFVFEHLPRPLAAMQALAATLTPSGIVLWAAPLFCMVHAHPSDYWRFTRDAAAQLAVDSGLALVRAYTPGSLGLLAGALQGVHADYWTDDEIFREEPAPNDAFAVATFAVFQRPFSPEAEATGEVKAKPGAET